MMGVIETVLHVRQDEDAAADERELAQRRAERDRLTETLSQADAAHQARLSERDAASRAATTVEEFDRVLALDVEIAHTVSRLTVIRGRLADLDGKCDEVSARMQRRQAEFAKQQHYAAIRATLSEMLPLAERLDECDADVLTTSQRAGLGFTPFGTDPLVPRLPDLKHWIAHTKTFLATADRECR